MFVITLGILVAIHEWGHFIAAKSVGVRVYEFALGMGPRLLTYMRRGGTDYTIRAFPIGGFVNPKGMQPDDPITSDGINGRRPAERALVYLSGPMMNMVLGIVVLCLSGAVFGVPDETKAVVAEVERKFPASQMEVVSRNGQPAPDAKPGLQVGDYILAVNGEPVKHRDDIFGHVNGSAGKPITFDVRRDNDQLVLRGTPRERSITEQFLVVQKVPTSTELPVQAGDQIEQIDGKYLHRLEKPGETPAETANRVLREKAGQPVTLTVWRNEGRERLKVTGPAGPLELAQQEAPRVLGVLGFKPYPGQGPRVSLRESVEQGLQGFAGFFLALKAMFSNTKQLGESVGGPVAIWVLLGQVGKLPLIYYFNVLASLSLSLAVFNLLPIFLLDGGHMLLLSIEVLRRRRLEPEYQKLAAYVGLAIIVVLFVLILYKDVMKQVG
jgi:regulator of sigma E protease